MKNQKISLNLVMINQIIIKLTIFLFFFSAEFVGFCQAPEIEWQNTIGGNTYDNLASIIQTNDFGYIVVGSSDSDISGDKTENSLGNDDYWIIKIDSYGYIEFQNTIGGNTYDVLVDVISMPDSAYILAGYSISGISGDKTAPSIGFSYDYWVVKINYAGLVLWDKTIGGDYHDFLSCIEATADGGFIVGGYSRSGISGVKTEPNLGLPGTYDYWVVKLDSLGEIEWQNTIGGADDDRMYSVKQTMDGGYLLGGRSLSNLSGDKTENNMGMDFTSDYWVIKLDSSGFIEWDNTIGGNNADNLISVETALEGGYILAGYSASDISGDKTEGALGMYNTYDYWIVKLDEDGVIEWQNTIWGYLNDYLTNISKTPSGYILSGYSSSNISGDKSQNANGDDDYWIVNIDIGGNILWEKTIGGNTFDYLSDVKYSVDGGYILGGYSFSNISGDKTESNVGSSDFWLVKLLPTDCDLIPFFRDLDGDGFGDDTTLIMSCIAIDGYVEDSTDCDDTNNSINPFSLEICNEIDDNCNFEIDEGLPLYTYFEDVDLDGYGNAIFSTMSCLELPPFGFVTDSTDCNDTNELVYEFLTVYTDADGDSYGDVLNSELLCEIVTPDGFVTNSLDCNDSAYFINPSSNEICNALDDNCNGMIDDGLTFQTFFLDLDNDNFGDGNFDTVTCLDEMDGYVFDSTDCNDLNPEIYPGAIEVENGFDDNCNMTIDEGFVTINTNYQSQIAIYPNPNYGIFEIKIGFDIVGETFVSFYDIYGNIIAKEVGFGNTLSISLPDSFSGLGVVSIELAGFIYYKRITILSN